MSTNTPSKWERIASMIFLAFIMFVLLKLFEVGRFADDFVEKKKVKPYTSPTELKYTVEKKKRTKLKGGYVACTSKKLFDEALTAAVDKDQRAIDYLLTHGCVIPVKGVNISILDIGIFSGTSKIRAYLDNGETVILYTNTENIYY